MMVWGLASIIIGEALVGRTGIGLTIVGVILGTILFRAETPIRVPDLMSTFDRIQNGSSSTNRWPEC